jgi:hypothetical protein
MTTPPSPLPDKLLRDLLAQLDLTEATLRQGQADALPVQAEALAQAILSFQRDFAALAPEATRLADWPTRLSAIDTRLRLLQQQLQVQSGSVQRALGTLFPAEQGNAYARLGGKAPMGGRPRVSNNTSLKA